MFFVALPKKVLRCFFVSILKTIHQDVAKDSVTIFFMSFLKLTFCIGEREGKEM